MFISGRTTCLLLSEGLGWRNTQLGSLWPRTSQDTILPIHSAPFACSVGYGTMQTMQLNFVSSVKRQARTIAHNECNTFVPSALNGPLFAPGYLEAGTSFAPWFHLGTVFEVIKENFSAVFSRQEQLLPTPKRCSARQVSYLRGFPGPSADALSLISVVLPFGAFLAYWGSSAFSFARLCCTKRNPFRNVALHSFSSSSDPYQ